MFCLPENSPEKSTSPHDGLVIGNWLNDNLATENAEKRKSNITIQNAVSPQKK
jgi:hypothetical protein